MTCDVKWHEANKLRQFSVESCTPGTGEGEYGQESLARKVTFEQRLEGRKRVSLENVGVMSLPEKREQ